MDAGTILAQYGLAGLVMAVLAGVVVYKDRNEKALQKRIDEIQNQRLIDAKETSVKLAEPMKQLATINDKMYEILIELNSKRGV